MKLFFAISIAPLVSLSNLWTRPALISPPKFDKVYFFSINQLMKKEIHPEYVECKVSCACGNTFTTKSNKAELRVDICSNCHPFFTGSEKIVDAAGRVEKFKKKYAMQ